MSAIVRMRIAVARPVLAWCALLLAAVISTRAFGAPHLLFGGGRPLQVALASEVIAPGEAIVRSLPMAPLTGQGTLSTASGGLPVWLQHVLLLTAFTAAVAFAVEPLLAFARRRKAAGPGRQATQAGQGGRPGAHGRPGGPAAAPAAWLSRAVPTQAARQGRHRAPSRPPVWSFARTPGRGTADVPARGIADAPVRGTADAARHGTFGLPSQAPWAGQEAQAGYAGQEGHGGRVATAARIVRAHHERLVVSYSPSEHTVYVLTPPGSHPRAVLDAARLVLPESAYQDLADHLRYGYA